MNTHACKRAISLLIALIMVVLSVPFAAFIVAADDDTAGILTNFRQRDRLGDGINFLAGLPLRQSMAPQEIFLTDGDMGDLFVATENFPNDKYYLFTHVTDASKFLNNNTNAGSIGIGVKAQMYMVTLEMQSKFGFEETSAYEKNSNMEYAQLSVINKYKNKALNVDGDRINRFWTQDENGNYLALNKEFVYDIENISLLGKTLDEAYATFFANYGTHILTRYNSGAEAHLTYSGDNLSEKTSIGSNWNSNVTVDGNIQDFLKMTAELEKKGSESSEYYDTIDGVSISGVCYGSDGLISPTDFIKMLRGEENNVSKWVSDVNDGNDVVLFDDNLSGQTDDLKMMPIWALLVKPEHQALRIELERYFNEHVDTQYAELYEKYIYNPTISEKDYSEYTLIASAEEFKQIKNDLGGMYVLCCDIDLGGVEWEPIGTAEEPFTGILDGNGATVKGLSVTATKDGAAGLFGYNEGTIRDLGVVGTINVTDTDHENKAAYIGGIVGHNAGTVSNCQNNVTVVSNVKMETGATGEKTNVSLSDIVSLDYNKDDDIDVTEPMFKADFDALRKMVGNDKVMELDLSTYDGEQDIFLDRYIAVRITGDNTGNLVKLRWDQSDNNPIYIELHDCLMYSSSIESESTRNVVLASTGTANSIHWGEVEIPNANLYIVGDADLSIRGRAGSTYVGYGIDGSRGEYGLRVSKLFVANKKTTTIIGGDGGNGSDGAKGSNGSGTWLSTSYQRKANSGGAGGAGGKGGVGSAPVSIKNEIVTFAGKLILQPGIGGNGGKGGQGGRGGDGVDGHTKLEYYPEIGGDGGQGGRGGDAGGIEFGYYDITCYNNAVAIVDNNVSYGCGGDGGSGGDGGTGGDGFKSPDVHVAYPPENGWHGASGGSAGRGGDGGFGTYAGDAGLAGTPGKGGAGGYFWRGLLFGKDYHGSPGNKGGSFGKGTDGSVMPSAYLAATYTTSEKLYTIYNESITYENAKLQKGGLIDNSVFATGSQNGAISPYWGNKSSLEVVKGDNPASSEYNYLLKVTSAYGEHSVHHGGYRHIQFGDFGDTYYISFLAKIPVGYRIELQNNHLGAGGYSKILSSDQGTGEWQWYHGLWHYGTSGDIKDCGYIAIDGGGLKEGETVDWYLAYTNMYRGFDPEFTSLISIGSEEEQQIANELLSMTTQKHVYIGLERVPGRPNWWQWADGTIMYVPSQTEATYGTSFSEDGDALYSNWDTAHYEPNNEIENVGMLWGAGDSEHELGTWNDNLSTSLLDGYITETKIGQAPAIDPTCNGVYAGGIVGYNAFGGKVENCINKADVTVDKAVSTDGAINASAGGIAGVNSGKVNNCYNTGNIKAYASSNSTAAWAQAYADQIAHSLTDGSVEGAVLSDVTCDAFANTVSDLDNDNHGTGSAAATEKTDIINEQEAYWARHEIGLTFNFPAEGDKDQRAPTEYAVDEALRKATLNVTVGGKTLVNYDSFYSFLKPGTRVVTISYEGYERSFPVRVTTEGLPCEHDGNKLDMPAVAPDCDEVGYTEGVFCLLCFTYISGHEEVPATGAHVDADGVWEHNENEHYHVCVCGAEFDFVPHSTTTANCVTNATCDVCGTEYGSVDSTIHVNTEVRDAVTPTCAEDGYTGDTYCADCGTFLASGKTITATGDHVDADGLWEFNGKNHYHTCACGTRFDTEEHFGGEATCSEKAYCEVCDADYGSLDPDNHASTTVKNVSEPTCAENGYTGDRVCLDCGTVLEKGETIPAWEHTYDDGTVTTAPTCTETGVKTFVCATCRHSYTETVPALGHDTVKHDAQAPTCTEIGWNAYETCARCDYTTYAELPALGHDTVKHDAQAPTCTEIGWNAYETCARCDHTTYAELPALGHDTVKHDAQAPTCTEIGWNAYETCARCDHTTYAELPAAGHSYVYFVCTVCGDTQIVEHGIELHLTDAQASAGGTVTVDIVLDKNVGFTYLNLGVNYDTDALELVSVTNGTIINSLTQGKNYIWSVAEDVTSTGVLATLTFKVKNGASAGDYAVTVTCTECCDETEQDIAVGITGGTVTVVGFAYGDCNGDGEVNGKDVTRLLRYLANYDPVTGDSDMDITLGADATGDGEINGKDVTRLLRYLANYDPATGESDVVLGK